MIACRDQAAWQRVFSEEDGKERKLRRTIELNRRIHKQYSRWRIVCPADSYSCLSDVEGSYRMLASCSIPATRGTTFPRY
ncbi:Hypothetical predicted protein [Octopus vulgaris]|uniref:Uncharacterized protein n=1 Tax=Octopus vulgaris TaxID=6645 RepID=A0AA36EYB2_OCTVU|nr:Hypothetical predicted protein [Octopus vulgaris]